MKWKKLTWWLWPHSPQVYWRLRIDNVTLPCYLTTNQSENSIQGDHILWPSPSPGLSFWFSCSIVYNSETPWSAACQASQSIIHYWSLLKLMSIELLMPSNHLILWHPLILLPSIFPNIKLLSNESFLCIRWPKYWSFSISPSNEYSGPISFRIDWLDLLAVQGTLKSLQHHSSKALILLCSAFFIVQLSHPYMTTGNTIDLNRWTFVGKVMSLLSNILSRLVITFLSRTVF